VSAEENEQNQPRDHSYDERDHSLDELAKGLADRSLSRRDALKWVVTAAIGGLLATIPGVAWAAKPTNPPVRGGKGPCGTTASGGPLTNCRGKCVDLQTNTENCGQCSRVCSQGESCQGGTCVGAPPPTVQCDNALNNCSLDDCICGAGTACAANGDCVLPVQCDNGLNNCATDACICGAGETCISGDCVVV
jgi:hypothetical protein